MSLLQFFYSLLILVFFGLSLYNTIHLFLRNITYKKSKKYGETIKSLHEETK